MSVAMIAREPTESLLRACEDRPLTLGALLDETVRFFPDNDAIAFDGRRLTYRELETEVDRMARGLVAAGLVKGMRVAIMISNRPEWVIAMFAIAKLGGVVVPVSTLSAPGERDHILRHADISILITQATFLKRKFVDELIESFPAIQTMEPGRISVPDLPSLRQIVAFGWEGKGGGILSWANLVKMGEAVDLALVDAMAEQVHPTDDGVIIYTSGSTALPKGVVHRHYSPCLQSWRSAVMYGRGPEERTMTANPLFWTAGFVPFLCTSVAAGACSVLVERYDPAAMLALVESERVTRIMAWPHQLSELADHPDAGSRDLTSLRRLPPGSPLAKFAPEAGEQWIPSRLYGLSETFTNATWYPPDAPAIESNNGNGFPMPGIDIRIADPETGRHLDIGEEGEIIMRGGVCARAYLKVKVEDYLDSDGFYHTKDSGFFDGRGVLHYTGRLSTMIKTKGANVSPMEVEAAIIALGDVRSAFVLGLPDAEAGEVVAACVVALRDADLDAELMRHALKRSLSTYKIPKHILTFELSDIPWTASNKVHIGQLRELVVRRLAVPAD